MTTRIALLLLSAAAVSSGCAQKRPTAKTSPPVARVAPTLPPPYTAPISSEEAAPDREKRPRFGASFVYVDGKPTGVIRFPELPATLKSREVHIGGGYHSTRYSLREYLRELKVDATKVKAVHLYGGKRVAVVDGPEFTRIGERLMLSFTQGDRGKPRIHFPSVKLNVNTTIDMLSNIAVYVDKTPPHLEGYDLVMPDGTVVADKVPYAPEEQDKGTRVYVDGVLVGALKRKKITNDMLLPTVAADTASAKSAQAPASVDHFSLLAYAGTLRADVKKAKTIDLVAGDDVIARTNDTTTLGFVIPQRNRGQAVIDVATKGTKRPARISAIQIYVSSVPPERKIVDVDDAPEAALDAGGQGGGSGSNEDF